MLLNFCEVKYFLRLKASSSNVLEKDGGLMKQKFLRSLLEQGWNTVAILKLLYNFFWTLKLIVQYYIYLAWHHN